MVKKVILFLFILVQFLFGAKIDNYISFEGKEFSDFGISQNELFICNPKIKGVYEYVNSKKINFYPNSPFIKGTKYSCSYNNMDFSFSSDDFDILNFKFLNNSLAMLEFNDFVNAKDLKNALKVTKREKLIDNDLSYDLKSDDNKTYFISFKDATDIFVESTLVSKYGAKIANSKKINIHEPEFVDIINASNLDDIFIKEHSFDDGNLGFRIYLKNYLEPSIKHIKVKNISKISIVDSSWTTFKTDNQVWHYYVEVKSDEFKPNQNYEISLLKGFGDDSEILRTKMDFNITTKDRKPFINFTDDKKFVPKNAIISFKSANISQVDVLISKIQKENLRYFLNLDENSDFVQEKLSKNFELNSVKNEIIEHKIDYDFKDYKDGIYKISLSFKDKDKRKQVSRVVYISDITASVTLSKDEAYILATRLSTAEPLSRAKVQFFSDKNELLHEEKTDRHGVLRIKQKDLLSKNPKSILIRDGKESGFVIFNEALVDISKTTNSARAILYLASDLISPNENISGVLALKNTEFVSLKNMPVALKIKDPKGVEIVNKSLKTDEFGVIKINENIGETTGFYNIEAIFEDKIIANKTFSVENFIPNRVKNDILTQKDEYYHNELIKANLVSNYLIGSPASKLKASLQSTYLEKKLNFNDGFSFVNETLENKNAINKDDKNFILDNEGKKELVIPNFSDLKVSNAYEIMLNFSTNDDGKNVNSYKNIVLYPFKTLTGIRANRDFVKTNDIVDFTTISLDSKTKKELNSNLNIEIYKNNFDYVYNGSRYVEQNDFSLIDSFEAHEINFTYKFSDSGNYVIVAKDYINGSSASVSVDVSGWGYYGKLNPKELQSAKIKLEKTTYKPKEIIKGVVNSQIKEGILNISLVADEILDYKVIELKNGSAEFELQTPKNFNGAHINAVIFRSSTKSHEPLRTLGNTFVSADYTDKKPSIEIINEKILKNKKTSEVIIKTEPKSKVVLFAVDEGILDIISQKELNAFELFNKPIYKDLKYYDIYDNLSTYFANVKELSFGGDSITNLAKAKRDLSPVKNNKEKSFIVLKDAISNDLGEARFDLAFANNFNSKVRLSALIISENGVNSVNSYMEVKDDIIIKPAQITYLVKNDDINLPISILNTTNEDKNLTIEITNSDNIKISNLKSTLEVKALQNAHESIKINALDLGDAYIKFLIKSKQNYQNEIKFNIISQYPASKFYKSGFIKSKEDFNISDDSYKEVFINVSANPNSLNIMSDLEKYPYGCTEQIASKMISSHYSYLLDLNQSKLDLLKKQAGVLISRLKNNGNFGYWSSYGHVNKYASIYASDILLWLDTKYKLLSNSQKELIFSALAQDHDDKFLQLYAYFILNQHKRLKLTQINSIYDNKIYENNLLSKYLMSAILKTNSMQKEFESLYLDIKKEKIQVSKFIDDYFDSDIRNAAFTLFIQAQINQKDEISDYLVKFITNNLSNVSSTQEKAFVIRAFGEYFKDKDEAVKFNLKINEEDKNYEAQISRKFDLNNKMISITPHESDGVFYSLLSFGYEAKPLKHQNFDSSQYYTDRQIKIYREFVDNNGKKVNLNMLKIGDRFFSKIKVYSNFWVNNLAIDEGISSCFEAVNERLYPNIRTSNTKDKVNFNHKEYLFDRVVYFPESFDGEIEIFTPFNVVMSGVCFMPAIKAEYMQDERLNDYDLEMFKFNISD